MEVGDQRINYKRAIVRDKLLEFFSEAIEDGGQ